MIASILRAIRRQAAPEPPEWRPSGDGWCAWWLSPPPRYQLVEAARQGWISVVYVRPAEMHIAWNVNGLWWRAAEHAALKQENDHG